jgi:hypothetical protein
MSDIVVLRLLKGTYTSTNIRRVFGRILFIAYDNYYMI